MTSQDGLSGSAFESWRPPLDLRTDRPHSARVYNFLLGGKTNYQPDRDAVARLLEVMPIARPTAVENRAFMHRAAHYVAAEAGIRQFLDVGTGIPTEPNLHRVVQDVDPAARVVYADNDPIVLAHSRALHQGTAEGRTAYVHGDLCQPDAILAEARRTLDFDEPVAVMLLTVLHWLPADADPYDIVRRLMGAVPAGSALVITHLTRDFDAPSVGAAAEGLNQEGSNVTSRTREQVAAFFDGLDLVEPGLEVIERWRPSAPLADTPALSIASSTAADAADEIVPLYAGVARKS
ncbi:SAM-dependent methyltransferase [Streptomyces sp. NBC_01497]|uniref:SAM-dependent methyltransferase n=1 Tax=Streptomyces sp. NBC_01497 TaxID=2903885 RepID=UPI002E35E6D8|nr:SAM-dependent methyltransferase [Streptomyces sp. NBC_01497]